MRPRHVFALGLCFLVFITVYLLGYSPYAAGMAGLGVLLGSLFPDVDYRFRNRWGHMKVLALLFAAFLVYLAYSQAPLMCIYLLAPFCENFAFIAILLLTTLFIVFDLLNPLSPPLHGLIPMMLFTISYSMLLIFLQQPLSPSILSTSGFFLGYLGNILGTFFRLGHGD
jgi:hypothetical protein